MDGAGPRVFIIARPDLDVSIYKRLADQSFQLLAILILRLGPEPWFFRKVCQLFLRPSPVF